MKINCILNQCKLNIIDEVKLEGKECVEIYGLNLCNRITEKKAILSYVTSSEYISNIVHNISVKALLVSEKDVENYRDVILQRDGAVLITKNPEKVFYCIHEYLCTVSNFYDKYDFSSRIGNNCNIDKSVIIQDGVIIGDDVTIGPLSVIKRGTIIDSHTTIGSGTVIGSEGFQLITLNDAPSMRITHVGRCHISSNVYIGDNVCVCNSLFEGETCIGENSKVDNLVYIAHNVHIEKNVVITAHVTICGSVKIEQGVWIAPNASILNRVVIGNGAKVGLGSVVTKDVEPKAVVYGNPAKIHSYL